MRVLESRNTGEGASLSLLLKRFTATAQRGSKPHTKEHVPTLVGEAPLFSHRLRLLVTSTGFRSCQRETETEGQRVRAL